MGENLQVLYIPDICQFWYSSALFRPVKSTTRSALICDKIALTGQNRPIFRVLYAKKYTALKTSTPPLVVTVVTSISYGWLYSVHFALNQMLIKIKEREANMEASDLLACSEFINYHLQFQMKPSNKSFPLLFHHNTSANTLD